MKTKQKERAFVTFTPEGNLVLELMQGTMFTYHPCSVCGKPPKSGDMWRVETKDGERREGHASCLQK